MTDEVIYKLLKAIEKCSKTNQRKLAEDLGVSLGRVNFFLNELVENGWVAVAESTTNKRRACLYTLTPSGFAERAAVTMRYLQSLIETQRIMSIEIENLRQESTQISEAIQSGLSALYGTAVLPQPRPHKEKSLSSTVSQITSLATSRLQPRLRKRA